MTVAPSLFPAAVGPTFAHLPGPVQALHRLEGVAVWAGETRVTGGNVLARLLARLAGFPPPSPSVPTQLRIEPQRSGERWTRWFGPHRLCSTIHAGPRPGTVVERFGPLRFEMALDADGTALRPAVSRCRIGPVALPRTLAPGGGATEDVDAQGRYRFAAEATLPGLGRLVRYEGWLVPGGATSLHPPPIPATNAAFP